MKKGNHIVVNCSALFTRIAILENHQLTEFFIEPTDHKGILNNIYKAKVLRVLPGMQSAFLDIGYKRTAFLYVDDIYSFAIDELSELADDEPEEKENFKSQSTRRPIEEILKDGQEIIVQVAKEPIGSKGPRVTTNISLPGRNIVYLPGMNQVGVSKKITDPKERERLRKIAEEIKPEKGGIIIRTVGEGKQKEDFVEDINFLVNLWQEIEKNYQLSADDKSFKEKDENRFKNKRLLYDDRDIVLKVLRDYMNSDFETFAIDNEEKFLDVKGFVEKFMPRYLDKIKLYKSPIPIFEKYNVKHQLLHILEREVGLESGGYIVIDEAEALTAIDVNTGSYIGRGKMNLEDTILKTNLEAARKIARELRLRSIGGIIVIDFIDMKNEEHKELVYNTLIDELSKDKAKTNVLKMSELGLIQLTRKRVRKSLKHFLGTKCDVCGGKGFHLSPHVIINDILISLEKHLALKTQKFFTIEANPKITKLLFEEYSDYIRKLETKYNKHITFSTMTKYDIEKYEIKARG